MNKRTTRFGFFLFLAATILLSSCSFNIDLGGNSPTPEPTLNTVVQNSNGYTLSTTQFVIPSQAFSLYPPEGWENQQSDSEIEVAYLSPDGSILITTRFTNTGYTLDQASFESYINGNQTNNYATNPNYAEASRELHLDQGYGAVYVTFDYNNVPQKVERLYDQSGNVIYETELWTDADKWDQNVDFFNQYLDGIRFDASKVASYEPYMFIQNYTNPDDLFSFEYLQPWKFQINKTDDKNFTSESYLSPEEMAAIDVWYFNDQKTTWSKGDAGQWAISNLELVYAKGSGDLKIDKDQINENGFEVLNWHSVQNKWTGITVFTAKDTRIALVTVVWANDYADFYQTSLEYVISTFASPAQ